MSTVEAVVSRIGSDLFALMVPGSYVLASIGVTCITIVSAVTQQDPLAAVSLINYVVAHQWPAAVALAALAYLIGQVIHAFPVNRADKICSLLLRSFMKNKWSVELYKGRFPYFNLLELIFEHLKTTHPEVPNFEVPNSETPLHTVFNFWKLAVCQEEPGLFALAQYKESRVRLYAGMFWSGLISITLAIVAFLAIPIFTELRIFILLRTGWTWILGGQLFASLVLTIMFGYHLRRVRGQEVETVFLSFLHVLEKRLKT